MQVVARADLLFAEVLNSVSGIVHKTFGGVKTPEARHQFAELEGILQREKVEFEVRPILDVKIYFLHNIYLLPRCIMHYHYICRLPK